MAPTATAYVGFITGLTFTAAAPAYGLLLLRSTVSPTAVIHSRSSSVVTSMVSDEMMLEVDSSPRKHIYGSSSSSGASRQTFTVVGGTVGVGSKMMLEVDSSARKHIYGSSSSASRQAEL
jgi:hypothetical protein